LKKKTRGEKSGGTVPLRRDNSLRIRGVGIKGMKEEKEG
jgi:hypothetical protein